MPNTPIVLETPQSSYGSTNVKLDHTSQTSSARRKPLAWNWKKSHKRKDSFALMMDEVTDEMGSSRGCNEPPSVDELKRIAEDIKNGLY
jgi:hypothetical protein